jgi:hypothetical protein
MPSPDIAMTTEEIPTLRAGTSVPIAYRVVLGDHSLLRTRA